MNESSPEVDAPAGLAVVAGDGAAPGSVAVGSKAGGDTAAASADHTQAAARRHGKHYRRRRHHGLVSLALVFIIAAALAVALRLFVVQTFYVPTGSMIPTLQVGDRMLVLKVGYSLTRGSIVVFRQPPNDTADVNHEDLVKRIIGLPGETIWSEGNTVYINGKPLAQPWLPKGTLLGQPITKQTIPKGEYFMMGDNRSESDDSRDWGDLPGRLIVGKVLVVIWRHGLPAFHIE